MNLITRVLVGLVIGIILAVGGVWFITKPQFNIQTVRVVNQDELKLVSRERVERLSAVRVNHNFFTVSLSEVKIAFEATPWVKQAEVQRVWPYTLEITLSEYEPVAYWGSKRTGNQLIDASGELFEADIEKLTGPRLPLFDGPTGSGVSLGSAGKMWGFYIQIKPMLETLGLEIDVLRLSIHGIWSIDLQDGSKITVGRGEVEELVKRVFEFVRTAPVALQPYEQRAVRRVDLRYSNGYALEISGVTTDAHSQERAARNAR